MKEKENKGFRMAMGRRARASRDVRPVGLMANWEDYPDDVKENFRNATRIYYPTSLYEAFCRSVGKEVFPRNYYRFMGNKIHQTQLFQLLEISHPRTRLFHGRHRVDAIRAAFSYPFVAKTPVGSSKGQGVFLIRDDRELAQYLSSHCPAYIQEYLPIDRDLRVVLIGARVVHAYWRIRKFGEFRDNVAQGASISFQGIPPEGLEFAVDVARKCSFDEIGMDICHAHGRYFILEANMVYGLEGFRQADLNLYELLGQMLDDGII